MADFLTFTSEQIAASPPLDPVFEHMLRSSFVHENVITAIRVQKIRNAATFAAMDSTAEDLKETCKEAFGIDPSKYGISHKVEWANVHNAWLASKVNVEVKTKVEAVTRAHGQPITLLTADWASLIVQFKTQYGMSIHDAKLPAQSYYESFEERLHNGIIEAETLAHVVSLADEREQIASKPEPPFQMGMHLDATLSLQTKKKYMSTMPTNTESLRTKYRIMTNLWLLAQLRQPGRPLYADLTKDTFNDFLEELLSDDNFLMNRKIDNEVWAAPQWAHCMEYEFQLRRDAMKLCREQGYGIQAALWATYQNQEHRMKHWVTLLSVANNRSESSCVKEMEQMRKQMAHMAQLLKTRSRSPRKISNQGKGSKPALALTNTPSASSSKGKSGHGKGDKGKKGGKGKGKGPKPPFYELITRLGHAVLHKDNTVPPGFCFPFQADTCKKANCDRIHSCAGCNKTNVPYGRCLCLSHL